MRNATKEKKVTRESGTCISRERVRARSYQMNVYDIKAIFSSEQRTGHDK